MDGACPGDHKCNAGSVPTVFVGESARANAKAMTVVETARAQAWEVYTVEKRRLLTQSGASSSARLPVGNDRRDSREVGAHSNDAI